MLSVHLWIHERHLYFHPTFMKGSNLAETIDMGAMRHEDKAEEAKESGVW